MKRIVFMIIIVLPVFAFCGRASISAEKADKECVSFYEWANKKTPGRAHNSAIKVFKER